MPSRPVLLTLLLTLALLAAGCLGGQGGDVTPQGDDGDRGGGDDTGSDPPGPGGNPEPTSRNLTVDAPPWAPGVWWRYRVEVPGEDPRTIHLGVVDRPNEALYRVLTDDEDLALVDAVLDVSFVGRVRAADLAGFQGDNEVKYFDWPLEDGRTWTTTWDGEERTVTAREATVATPRGPFPGFELTAVSEDGSPFANYTYVPAFGWFTELRFLEQGVNLTVEDAGYGTNLTFLRADATTLYRTDMSGVHGAPFEVDAEATHVVATAIGGGSLYGQTVQLRDPSGNLHGFTTTPCLGCGESRLEVYGAEAGMWELAAMGGSPDGPYHLMVHAVGLHEMGVDYGVARM